ncbi:3-keto-disaccharide hydrolase [Armatimonas rosea]|uniref:3-keto-alpha-glucoside-1,2-lyase/3-keto-2-hydroxy-glucal hydratase domain-containing protein n=1 Tax=Armatimonas rosea TaxID=685828 RepID=A0A7W9W7M2_ARMRO|nr:DUF1080 domain-containing protein [Armatimonas rosea]MBB6051828.1 hypothetical protein [Armatimonas rosea]
MKVKVLAALAALVLMVPSAMAQKFEKIFDGTTLNGWKLIGGHGPGYVIKDGCIVCPADGGGNLFTEKEYSDFVYRFEFKLTPGANNGIGLRAPYEGDAAYVGMECQVLDDPAPVYAKLEPGQYHGSIYKVLPAKRGALKPTGEWNKEEIRCEGRRITVTLNGKKIVEGDLNAVSDPATLAAHPGMLRPSGHIGFLGHNSEVWFRNLEVKDLSKAPKDNVAPKGFTALFNGKDLKGWKGLLGNPLTRAKLSPEELAAQEKVKTDEALKHWTAKDGVICYDGKNDSLCTVKDYKNFELLVSWKIGPGGDSGIYLRGSPQVQIWDTALTNVGAQVGSGGLYNNQKNPSKPTQVADNPVGEWNEFRILMVGDRVTVYLNNKLVVQSVQMENYWDRKIPIFPTGQIELQHHGNPIFFKNIYVRELP